MTNTPDKSELLPCPFCGTQPTFDEPKPGNWGTFSITCGHCPKELRPLQSVSQYRESAIAAWNTRISSRPPADQVPDMVEVVKAARSHLHAMQHQARQYLEPKGYTSFDRKQIALEYDQEAKDSLFTSDMIYLLDGPEQRELEAKIDAALQAVPAASEVGWQPIESAPKDGTPLLLFARCKTATAPAPVIGWWVDELGWIESCFTPNRPIGIVPTAWMPRPEFPPALKASGEK